MQRKNRVYLLAVLVLLVSLVPMSALAQEKGPTDNGSRGGAPDFTPPIVYTSPADFSESFDDITLLPGIGWYFQNNSSPLGLTDWFQGNDTVFPAQAGAATAYIGANYNNTDGVGTISNWMLTPEVNLADGDTISFWTRVPTDGGVFPDRLELRLSTAGASTNVGTLATDVGDFTTLLLSVNPDLTTTGYPEVWTQFSATLSGIPAGATGRIAFRYFVTGGGPSGNNSNYIGIDTVEYVSNTGGPSISVIKTVGTVPGVCATTNTIIVAAGTTVYYCYEVTNTGDETLNLHDLVDDQLGTIFSGLNYALTPGSSVNTVAAGLSISTVINSTTTNVATWTAYNTGGPTVTATATATVTVEEPGNLICNTSPIDIASFGPGTPYPSTISVSGLGTTVDDVNVSLYDVNHTWPNDIDILLVGPQGQNLIIMSDAGGSNDLVNVDLTFDDAAAGPLPDEDQIVSGSYQPTNWEGTADTFPAPAPLPSTATQLATFNGTDPNGTWSLYVVDDLEGDSGNIAGGWCLDIAAPPVFSCNTPAEGFESGVPPTGWSVETTEPNGPQWTTIANCGESGNFTNGSGDAACASSDVFGAAEFDTSLVSPVFDLTGVSAASIYYTANYQNFAASDYLDLDISSDGGATWTTVLSWNEDHGIFRSPPGVDVSVDLGAWAGQSGLKLRWHYYDPNTGDYDWYAQVDDVGLDCTIGEPPNIDVDPLSMASAQPPDTTVVQGLDVSNTGGADLVWNIDEEPALPSSHASGPSSIAKLRAPNPVQRSAKQLRDLVESPTADVVQDGSFEAGTPNPFWNESSTTFGTPLCNEAGCGTGGGTSFPLTGDWWAWFGGIAAYEAGNVSQSVTIPSGGPASLTFWVMNGSCSGDANDYLGAYIDGTQLWATDGAAPECGTLGYRQIMLDVSAYADGGAHLLEFNSEIFGSDVTNFALDDVALDAQGGGGQTCSAPSDVPWLGVSPNNGTTAPAATTPVDVTFDSTGLAPGAYNANLCVTSNDPDAGPGNETGLVIVPVTLTVQAAPSIEILKTVGTTPGVCATTSNIEVPTGTTVYYCYTVTNTGDVTLNLHDLVDDQLGTIFSGLNYPLTPGSSVDTVAAGLTISDTLYVDTTNVATWTAYNAGGSSVSAYATAHVHVLYMYCNMPNETFEGGVPPMGWTVVNNVAGGASWGDIATCDPSGSYGNWTGGGGNAACMSPGTLEPPHAYDAELRSPPFSLVGQSAASASYLVNYQSWAGNDRLNLDISPDGGVTWITLKSWNDDHGAFQSLPGESVWVDLAPWLGQGNLMLRWHYFWDAPTAIGWYAQVDNVGIDCTELPPTAVTLNDLSIATAQLPAPLASLPLAALPAAAAAALGAAFVWRRQRD